MPDREAKETQVSIPSFDTNTSNEQESSGNSSLTSTADLNYVAPNMIKRAKTNPGSLTPANILALQRTIGNRTVMRFLVKAERKNELFKHSSALKTIQRLPPDKCPVDNGYPPPDHQVVDIHITDEQGRVRMDLPTSHVASKKCPDNKNLYVHTYKVGGWNVFLVWPKGWNAPAPNRYGILPKCEFGTPSEAQVKTGLTKVEPFTYNTIQTADYPAAQNYTPGTTFNPDA